MSIELAAIPYACSMAAHIALREAGLPHRIRWLARGEAATVHPKAKVPVLWIDGVAITENPVVLDAIAERAGWPRERPAELQWLCFVTSELHAKLLYPAFDPASPAETRRDVLERVAPPALAHVERSLEGREHIASDRFSVADAYLMWALLLIGWLDIDLGDFPLALDYRRRLKTRASVAAALASERERYEADHPAV